MRFATRALVNTVPLFVFAFVVLLALPSAAPAQSIGDAEILMGRRAVREVEKNIELVEDPEILLRVRTIGAAVAHAANSLEVPSTYGTGSITEFKYTFKVIDTDEVNAFCLPGGYVYIHKGLLDYVESDHELAGVLAHEIAHAAHHHMAYLIREQGRLDTRIALVLLAGIVGNVDTKDLGHVLVGAQLVRIAFSSGYGQEAEADADRTAIAYVQAAGYNPVGLLTFMERLARDHAAKPQMDMGIFRTHPLSTHRARAMVSQIEGLGLPIRRREVTNAVKAVAEKIEVDGRRECCVKLGGSVILRPAPVGGVLTAEERADAIAAGINRLLDQEPPIRRIKLDSDGRTVSVCGEPVFAVTEQDAALNGKSPAELAEQAAETLRTFVWRQTVLATY